MEIQMMFTSCIVEVSHLKASRKNRNLFFLSKGKWIHLFSLTPFSINSYSARGEVGFLRSVKLWTWKSFYIIFLGTFMGISLMFWSATVIWNVCRYFWTAIWYICSVGYQLLLEYFPLENSTAELSNQGGRDQNERRECVMLHSEPMASPQEN